MKQLVIELFALLREKLQILNFWKRSAEVKKLQGEIDDKLDFRNIPIFSHFFVSGRALVFHNKP